MTLYNINNNLEQKSLWNFLKKYKKSQYSSYLHPHFIKCCMLFLRAIF